MRSIGWDRKHYPKAAHELRRAMGARWWTEQSPQVAQALLGHQQMSTTCQYYATLDRQPPPLARDAG
jgi:integrase